MVFCRLDYALSVYCYARFLPTTVLKNFCNTFFDFFKVASCGLQMTQGTSLPGDGILPEMSLHMVWALLSTVAHWFNSIHLICWTLYNVTRCFVLLDHLFSEANEKEKRIKSFTRARQMGLSAGFLTWQRNPSGSSLTNLTFQMTLCNSWKKSSAPRIQIHFNRRFSWNSCEISNMKSCRLFIFVTDVKVKSF